MFYNNKKNDFLENDEEQPVISIITGDLDDQDCSIDEKELADEIPILALRNTIIFPGTSQPIAIARKKSLKAIRSMKNRHALIGLVCQKDSETEDPDINDLYEIGVVGEVLRVIELSDDENITVIFQGKKRFRLNEITQHNPFLKGKYTLLESKPASLEDKEYIVLLDSIRELTLQMMRMFGEPPKELVQRLNSQEGLAMLVNYCCTNLPIQAFEKQELLNLENEKDRAYRLLMILNRETQMMEMKMNIQMKTREELNQQQKEYFLQQQIKAIQDELGGNPQQAEIDEFRILAKKKKWNAEVGEAVEKEIKKLERLHPQSPDYSTQFSYIQTVLELPWNEYTKDNFNLKNA